jgi:hypothetical protein
LAEEKKATVARILDNLIYLPESAVVVHLTHLLTSRLALHDLRELETVIGLKKKGD